jgi:SAM-dependent methyltransferase
MGLVPRGRLAVCGEFTTRYVFGMTGTYVHGYDEREARRLADQANTLVDLLHYDSRYPEHSRILEAGCGVGAQTVTLARQNPTATITSIDVSVDSLRRAEQECVVAGITNVTFEQGDIFDLRFDDGSFDHVFVCFVLEHLSDPAAAVRALSRVIKPGGTLAAIEGDHGSTFFHPASQKAQSAINCQVALQNAAGGNANIGRQLYPLLTAGGLESVVVSPRHVYVDGSRPEWIEGFTRNTFTAMIEGVREASLAAGLIDARAFDEGVRDLHRTAAPDGVFNYMFFKATGKTPARN